VRPDPGPATAAAAVPTWVPIAVAAPVGWTTAPRVLGAVGPVYFLYGGASVWTLVR
jgi:hypothetical protein